MRATVVTTAMTAAAAVVGSLGTTPGTAWYAGWCWAFFKKQSPSSGLAAIAVLNALNLALVREAAERDRRAGAALWPYAVWTGFATALNLSIWRRNR